MLLAKHTKHVFVAAAGGGDADKKKKKEGQKVDTQ